MQDKGLPTETENNEPEKKKKSIFQRETINLVDGHGPLTDLERTRLLAFSLVNKHGLYAPQSNDTIAACVNEYLDATRNHDVQEPLAETNDSKSTCDTDCADDNTDAQLDLLKE